jgi:single-strand DNA-binding protein
VSKDLNKIMIIGRLGADPEMRYTPQGTPVTTFRVAAGRSWKDADGTQHEETEWFRVVAWNKMAEVCNTYLTRGARVYVEGRLQTRRWQEKETGQDHFTTEVIAGDMIMLEGRKADTSTEAFEPAEEPEVVAPSTSPARRTPASAPARAAGGNGTSGRSKAGLGRTLPRSDAFPEEDLPF